MLAKLYILWIYSKPNQCTLYNCAGHASILCHCTGKYNLIVSAGITAVAMYISSAAEVLVYMCRSYQEASSSSPSAAIFQFNSHSITGVFSTTFFSITMTYTHHLHYT